MKNNKIAALALSSTEAPQDVKDLATKITDASIRFKKAERQIHLWQREKEFADKAVSIADREFSQAFEQWDPAGQKSKDKEEVIEDV